MGCSWNYYFVAAADINLLEIFSRVYVLFPQLAFQHQVLASQFFCIAVVAKHHQSSYTNPNAVKLPYAYNVLPSASNDTSHKAVSGRHV